MTKKVCAACGYLKELSEFHRQNDKKDGRRAHCKECRRANYQRNRTTILKARKEYQDGPAYREWKQAYDREYVEKNREKRATQRKDYREKNREEINRKKREQDKPGDAGRRWAGWKKKNPEKVRESSIRADLARRAKKNSTHKRMGITEVYETKRHGCFFCRSMEDLTLAHDIPIGPTGPTTRANTFCLCRGCNSRMNRASLAEVLSQTIFEGFTHDRV